MNVIKRFPKLRNDLIAGLDVGASKVCCFIARLEEDGTLHVIGVGQHHSQGLRAGAIVDMEAVRAAVLAAVHGAEKIAGETLRSVFVNLSGGKPSSDAFAVEVEISGHEVSQADVRRVLEYGRHVRDGGDRQVIHSIPMGFRIDGSGGIRDPRGMYGERLGVDVNVISAATGAVRNLATCIAGCHLDVDAFVVTPYASGLSCLVEDEMTLGATVIDMGGGTTTIAVFDNGEVVYADSVPLGGIHVTTDIAHGLSTPLAQAERLKILYGSASVSMTDEHQMIDVPPIGEDDSAPTHHVPKSLLVGIIQPRLEETFEMVRERLEAGGRYSGAARRVVLTGGASQLHGAGELAALVLDRQVRIGRPRALKGLADATSGPAFATCAGLLVYAARKHAARPIRLGARLGEPFGLFGRIGNWLHENL